MEHHYRNVVFTRSRKRYAAAKRYYASETRGSLLTSVHLPEADAL